MTEPTSTGLVQQFVERTGQLYSLPAVAAEVLRLTSEPTVDTRALRECIERDPALTARILRAVNSSLFGLSRNVTDLHQALALLGIRPLKMLVLGFSLPKELFGGVTAEVLARYWQHALIKAVAARELAERVWHTAGDEAFTAGLMQDLGVLVLVQQLREPYLKLLEHAQTHGGNVLDHELETLGFDHAILGARLLMHWGLPAPLCAAIAVAPDETQIAMLEADEQFLPQVLHLAELLACLVERPYGPALHQLLQIGGHYHNLTFAELQPIVAVLQVKVKELAEVLALELPSGENYVDLLVAAHERLAEITMEAIADRKAAGPEEDLLELAGHLRREINSLSGSRVTRTPPLAHSAVAEQAPSGGYTRTDAPRPSRSSAQATIALEPALGGRVAAAVNSCRQARCPISLAIAGIDGYTDLLAQAGPENVSELVHWLRLALGPWCGQRAAAVLMGDSNFLLVWEDCSRSDALAAIRSALEAIRSTRIPVGECDHLNVTLSFGLATLALPPKNFPAGELILAAQRCLSGAMLSGGNTLKSIEF